MPTRAECLVCDAAAVRKFALANLKLVVEGEILELGAAVKLRQHPVNLGS
jgi:hypothetical protein